MAVEPNASAVGAYWVVFAHPTGDKLYSSYDVQADADEMAAIKNAEQPQWPYRVIPRPA